ncbi:hypothetical protein SAMN04488057_12616 [Cyclobacterium lianum]|uniref:DUF4221 domain-containing protein n=1 Tax=Cyclobacterium lianum TaxID=388280 RepID=A0A1M7QUB9_9BACT|nr:hypothetical protein [Cyclobacterium lianum]SHN35403.1 hypothetical protein SAMN04488057_12616 [Cyclobacterium lianum]
MSNLHLISITLLAICLLSCSRSQKETTDSRSYALQLVDSLRVDYMGNLELKDYDPETNQYLAYNQQKKEVLIFDTSGDIQHSFILQSEGPEAIIGYGPNPTFAGSKICIFADKIYTLSQQGKVLNRVEIPYPYFWIVGGGHIAAFALGDKLLYYKPESAEAGQDMQAAYQRMLDGGAMMEVLDTLSGDYYPTMHFPETDAFEEGLFYGYPTPLIQNGGSQWFLSVNNALEFHVYNEKEQRLDFQETVRIPAQNAYLDQPVPLEQMNTFFEENGLVYRIPQIHRFLPLEDHILVVYSKGVSPETKAAYDVSDPEQRRELVYSFPMEFAVFDSDFKNLAVDLAIPKSINPFSALVDKKGQIVALKDQEQAGVEEDFHTLYTYRLDSGE